MTAILKAPVIGFKIDAVLRQICRCCFGLKYADKTRNNFVSDIQRNEKLFVSFPIYFFVCLFVTLK